MRVFDGRRLTEPTTVVLEGGRISARTPDAGADVPAGVDAAAGADIVDGRGGVLLPGLIDTHVHIDTRADLEACARWGVTTVLDMAAPDLAVIAALRHQEGLPDLLSAGYPASAPGGMHTRRMGFPAQTALSGPSDAPRFVAERVAQGADYVKVIVEDPKMPGTKALDPVTIAALVTAAHAAGRIVIAHAVTTRAQRLAVDAGVDVVTHTPLNAVLTPDLVEAVKSRGTALSPTLTMMRGTARTLAGKPLLRLLGLLRIAPRLDYENASASVGACHRGGVTILAGTDSNNSDIAPASPRHGEALHDELALLVGAGLSPVEALRSATVVPATVFHLPDRGSIEVGQRADLLLVDGDPTRDITATRAVRGVWISGTRVG